MNVRIRIPMLTLLLCLFAYLFWAHTPHPWTWMQTLGLCMMLVGFPLWLVAHIQLGASFGVTAQARALVTRGLYAKIRSPIYVFGSVGIAGAILFERRPLLLLVFVVLLPLQIVRTRAEGRVLEAKFGEEYRNYVRRTWI
jgi:protein-S-isoprenylcysteine O-methyltransferase Ste14